MRATTRRRLIKYTSIVIAGLASGYYSGWYMPAPPWWVLAKATAVGLVVITAGVMVDLWFEMAEDRQKDRNFRELRREASRQFRASLEYRRQRD